MTAARRPTRGQIRAQRRTDYWTGRRAHAATPVDRVNVSFDWVRARVAALPGPEQDAIWATLADYLDGLARGEIHSELHTPAGENESPTRTDTRGAARARARGTHPIREGARS